MSTYENLNLSHHRHRTLVSLRDQNHLTSLSKTIEWLLTLYQKDPFPTEYNVVIPPVLPESRERIRLAGEAEGYVHNLYIASSLHKSLTYSEQTAEEILVRLINHTLPLTNSDKIPIENRDKKKRRSCSLKPVLYDEVVRLSKKHNLTLAHFLTKIIRRYEYPEDVYQQKAQYRTNPKERLKAIHLSQATFKVLKLLKLKYEQPSVTAVIYTLLAVGQAGQVNLVDYDAYQEVAHHTDLLDVSKYGL